MTKCISPSTLLCNISRLCMQESRTGDRRSCGWRTSTLRRKDESTRFLCCIASGTGVAPLLPRVTIDAPVTDSNDAACVTGEEKAVFSTAATSYRCLNGDDHDIVKKLWRNGGTGSGSDGRERLVHYCQQLALTQLRRCWVGERLRQTTRAERDILTTVLEHVKVQLASHPCEEGGHRRDAGLGEGARLECLGRRRHGRRIGRSVLPGSAGGGGQEEGSARIGVEWPVLAGPTR
nr:uncharacterized protein LOC127323227 [Lolium perenne]